MKQHKVENIYLSHPEIILAGLEHIDPEILFSLLKDIDSSFRESLDHRDKLLLDRFMKASGDVIVVSEIVGISLFSVHRLMKRISMKAELWQKKVA
jgi:hypothetical protein